MKLLKSNLPIISLSERDAVPIQKLTTSEDFSTSNTKQLREDSNE